MVPEWAKDGNVSAKLILRGFSFQLLPGFGKPNYSPMPNTTYGGKIRALKKGRDLKFQISTFIGASGRFSVAVETVSQVRQHHRHPPARQFVHLAGLHRLLTTACTDGSRNRPFPEAG
jgi:hypothetical protein